MADEPQRPWQPTKEAVVKELWEILGDACVVVFWILFITGIEWISHMLSPPKGPVFYLGGAIEFPLQWMIDTAHVLNFGGFVVSNLMRTWRHW